MVFGLYMANWFYRAIANPSFVVLAFTISEIMIMFFHYIR